MLSPEIRARLRASNVHIQRGDVSQKMDDAAARQRTVDLEADVRLLGESLLTLITRQDTSIRPHTDENPHPASCYIATNQLKVEQEAARQSG